MTDMEEKKKIAARRLVEMMYPIAVWHRETFIDTNADEQKEKFNEELSEAIAYQGKDDMWEEYMMELADMFIVICGLENYDPYASSKALEHLLTNIPDRAFIELPDYVKRKMDINRKRKWSKNDGVWKGTKEQ